MSGQPVLLVLGAGGQLGHELVRALAPLGRVVPKDHAALDLADFDKVRLALREIEPDVVLNAAAYTNVDGAEAEQDRAMLINGEAPGVIAECAAKQGALMVHYSTDYVFSGSATQPYTENDAASPVNAYGRSKLSGELAVQAVNPDALILRVSWMYSLRGRNFLNTIHHLSAQQGKLRIVNDQYGCPTWVGAVAQATAQLLELRSAAKGRRAEFAGTRLFHMASADHTTWHGLATAIVESAPGSADGAIVAPIASSEYPTIAQRPKWSVLDSTRLWQSFQIRLPEWRAQLQACLSNPSAVPV